MPSATLFRVPKRACQLGVCCVISLVAVITLIATIAASFGKVDEGQACMRYSTWSGEMDDEVQLTPSNSFIGLRSGYYCYPKTIQELEFHRGGDGIHRVLGTRTLEGLFIELDIHIEFRIVPEEARLLFDQFGEWDYVVSNLTLVARSVLRNTASAYGGLEYMTGDRAFIASGMQADLHSAFEPFHCSVSEVNIRHISLTSAFERAFEEVRAVQLAASKALQTREVDITHEQRSNESAVINVLALRETTLLNARAEVTRATLAREAAVTAKETEAITAKLKAESSRSTRLTNAKSSVNKATSQREARLTEARVRNSEATLQAEKSRGVILIEAQSQVETELAKRGAQVIAATLVADSAKVQAEKERNQALAQARARYAAELLSRAELLTQANTEKDRVTTEEAARRTREAALAKITVLQANATANAMNTTEAARILGLAQVKEADQAFLQQLQSKASLTPAQVLRYLHLQALQNFTSGGDADNQPAVFVDYKKVPLVLEAAGNNALGSMSVSADANLSA